MLFEAWVGGYNNGLIGVLLLVSTRVKANGIMTTIEFENNLRHEHARRMVHKQSGHSILPEHPSAHCKNNMPHEMIFSWMFP